jgi:hypothetical protein
MPTYMAHGISFENQSPKVFKDLLACPTIEQLMFPAVLPLDETQELRLSSPKDIDIESILGNFVGQPSVYLSLISEHDIRFEIHILLESMVPPNVFNLRFSQTHLQAETVTFAKLKKILEETVPIFHCEHFSVYPKPKPPRRPKYFVGPDESKYYPVRLGWLTYFGPDLVQFLSPNRLDDLTNYREEETSLGEGILIVAQDCSLDPEDPNYWAIEKEAISELKLEKYVRKQW